MEAKNRMDSKRRAGLWIDALMIDCHEKSLFKLVDSLNKDEWIELYDILRAKEEFLRPARQADLVILVKSVLAGKANKSVLTVLPEVERQFCINHISKELSVEPQ